MQRSRAMEANNDRIESVRWIIVVGVTVALYVVRIDATLARVSELDQPRQLVVLRGGDAGVCRWRRVGADRQFTRQKNRKPGHEHPAEQNERGSGITEGEKSLTAIAAQVTNHTGSG